MKNQVTEVAKRLNGGFVTYNQGWQVTSINPQAAQLFNKSCGDLLEKNFWFACPELVGSKLYRECHQAIAQQSLVRFEQFFSSLDTWFEVTIYPTSTGITLYFHDITERKQLEIYLEVDNSSLLLSRDTIENKLVEQERTRLIKEQAARAEAERANRIKDEFLAVLSHELRSPLNPILGWARLLQTRQYDNTTLNRALEIIERNAKIQAQLIEDLLDVSRILRGKLKLKKCPVNLSLTVEAAIETVRLAAQAKTVEINLCCHSNVSKVLGDPDRLQQVIWNLLSNAVKFTPSGGRIQIELKQVDSQAQITVNDNGEGIAPEFLPYVFDYFRQADSSITRSTNGLGLGLAIVRHLVELHGGTVTAQSQGKQQGATFIVRLPIMSGTVQEKQPDRPLLQAISLAGLRILIVDDEADSREFVAFLLEQQGAITMTAASAHQALQIFTQLKPDLLISDIGMPQVDGYSLLRQMQTLNGNREILAIALTAHASESDQQQAYSAGFQRHIAKPIEPEKLLATIANLLDKDLPIL